MERITIIYRASDHNFGVHAKDRFFSKSKTEVSKTCFMSLYQSFLNFNERVNFVVLGDRLSDDLQNFFSMFPNVLLYTYNGSGKKGLHTNIEKTLKIAEKVNTDWVWIQEDDYLFVKNAGRVFFDFIDNRSKILSCNKNLVVFPTDYSDRYKRLKDKRQRYKIFLGNYGYWREVHNTTFSFCMTTKELNLKKHMFEKMLNEVKFKTFDSYLSNKIWHNQFCVVSPMPSLSLHLDAHVTFPPCVDWEEIWNYNFKKVHNGLNNNL